MCFSHLCEALQYVVLVQQDIEVLHLITSSSWARHITEPHGALKQAAAP